MQDAAAQAASSSRCAPSMRVCSISGLFDACSLRADVRLVGDNEDAQQPQPATTESDATTRPEAAPASAATPPETVRVVLVAWSWATCVAVLCDSPHLWVPTLLRPRRRRRSLGGSLVEGWATRRTAPGRPGWPSLGGAQLPCQRAATPRPRPRRPAPASTAQTAPSRRHHGVEPPQTAPHAQARPTGHGAACRPAWAAAGEARLGAARRHPSPAALCLQTRCGPRRSG
jgi:hypothetical protein